MKRTMPSSPELEFAFEAHVGVGPLVDLGQTPRGHRRIVPIIGGTFAGPGLKGRVLPGADSQILRGDGVLEVEARYTLETDDGALISVVNRGIRHASAEVIARLDRGEHVGRDEMYFRTVPRFETAAAQYQWLTHSVFIGVGERLPRKVIIEFWKIL